MKLGNNFILIIIFFILSSNFPVFSEDKITSTPLINLNDIKPSFEVSDEKGLNPAKTNLKTRDENSKTKNMFSHAILVGLDKITAKASKITVKLNQAENFGPLEIRILKCGKVLVNNKLDDVAYMQVKDVSKNENEKVFIFNGWTFASDPNITPFDHAIYDLQLLNCKDI